MPDATSEELKTLVGLTRQLRTVPLLREKRPGVFTLSSQVFVQFVSENGLLYAELRAGAHKTGGFERFSIANATEQRKFLEEVKRRAVKFSDD